MILSDQQVDSMDLGQGSLIDLMWTQDAEAVVPNDGSIPDPESWFPAPGGIRVFTWVKQPVGATPPTETSGAEVRDFGLAASYESEHPGMHTSQTVDVNVVLSGELWLELDDGVTTHLRPGDVVIQNGTRHKWENRTDKPTTVLSVGVGAHQRDR